MYEKRIVPRLSSKNSGVWEYGERCRLSALLRPSTMATGRPLVWLRWRGMARA